MTSTVWGEEFFRRRASGEVEDADDAGETSVEPVADVPVVPEHAIS